MATNHIVGDNFTFEVDKKKNQGVIRFDLLEPKDSTSGKMKMILSTPGGFTPLGVSLDSKPLSGNIQIGFSNRK